MDAPLDPALNELIFAALKLLVPLLIVGCAHAALRKVWPGRREP